MTIQDLIARLNHVEPYKEAGHYRASCPCKRHTHGDRSRGLEFFQDDNSGKIVMHCHAGCEVIDICEAIGITQADLMPEPSEDQKRRNTFEWYGRQLGNYTLEAAYSYCYGDYKDGLTKVKYRRPDGKKDFRWAHNDPRKPSGITFNHTDCPHRLYIRGDYEDNMIFLAEGEKDADTLNEKFKVTAASTENGAGKNSGGGKWRKEYTAQITGKDVYILWDNDKDGRDFAQIECAEIINHAASVHMLDILKIWPDCPEKGDITDMVKALGTDEAINRLAQLMDETTPEPNEQALVEDPILSMDDRQEQEPAQINDKEQQEEQQEEPKPERAPADSISAYDLFIEKAQTTAFKPIPTGIVEFDELINGGFIRQTLVTLGASPGAGKTIIAQQIFEAAAECGNANILYYNLEMSQEQLISRSISRRSGLSPTDAMRGYKWDDEQWRKVMTATDYCKAKIAPYIAYNPGADKSCKSSAYYQDIIMSMVTEATLRNDDKPLIAVIDYLQLLQSRPDDKGRLPDDVETIKAALKAFKDFSIQYNAVVFLIMAHSRATNNAGTITQGAGRDTSAIEYSGDLQLSLNYGAIADGTYRNLDEMETAINDPTNTKADESLYNYRCLTVTKNRFGQDRCKCYLTFYGRESRFDFSTRCRRFTPSRTTQTRRSIW